MFRKVLLSLVAIFAAAAISRAAGGDQPRHEVHLGYGDSLMETVLFRDRSYLPHMYAEYDYTIWPWLSVGAQVDFSGFWWDDDNCYNIAVMPHLRFNWLRRDGLSLYSALRAGVDINTGTETNVQGNTTDTGLALGSTFLGISCGRGPVFATVELAPITAMKGRSIVFLAGSRLISFSLGYRF